jgi:hypothetical protein
VKPTGASPKAFIDRVKNETRRKDGHELAALMQEITGEPPVMWGPSIVGFGQYTQQYANGREGRMMLTGFSPRAGSLVLYIGPAIGDEKLMAKLGKHKKTEGCLYVNKLADVDRAALREIVERGVAEMRARGRAAVAGAKK